MLNVLVVDDHWLHARAVAQEVALLRPAARLLEASTLAAALALIAEQDSLDFVLLDLKLPDARHLDAVHAVRRASPQARVAVVSAYDDPNLMREAFDAGAVGYLTKGEDPEAFKRALALLLSGGFYFPAEALERQRHPKGGRELTPREGDVLNELKRGRTTKAIARLLGLAPTTVDKHVEQIRAKFGAKTRVELLAHLNQPDGEREDGERWPR